MTFDWATNVTTVTKPAPPVRTAPVGFGRSENELPEELKSAVKSAFGTDQLISVTAPEAKEARSLIYTFRQYAKKVGEADKGSAYGTTVVIQDSEGNRLTQGDIAKNGTHDGSVTVLLGLTPEATKKGRKAAGVDPTRPEAFSDAMRGLQGDDVEEFDPGTVHIGGAATVDVPTYTTAADDTDDDEFDINKIADEAQAEQTAGFPA